MEGIRRLRLVRFFRVRRRFFAISKPPEQRPSGIGVTRKCWRGEGGSGGEI